jgi:regulating synaptic membrane exocytosis protein 2
VLVTSPGSPDVHGTGRVTTAPGRYANRLTPAGPIPIDPNVGGRLQIKLGFEPSSLQLIVTVVCAAGLTIRSNGACRNPYAKVSDKNFFEFNALQLLICFFNFKDFSSSRSL